MNEQDVVRCPRCTRPNRLGTRRCAGCGATLPEPEPRPDARNASETTSEAEPAHDSPELLYQHASSLMDLSDMGAAAPLFQRILAADPTNAPALDQLEAIYRSAEQWAELTELLASVAEKLSEPTRRTELLERAATIAEQMLADSDRARALRGQIGQGKVPGEGR